MLIGNMIPPRADIEDSGIRLPWRSDTCAARYTGSFVAWRDIRDADPEALGHPQLRLRDGRTVFLPANASQPDIRGQLAQALHEKAVPIVERSDAWGSLLDPFLDRRSPTDDAAAEAHLERLGFEPDEVIRIRRRVRASMHLWTLVSWTWDAYGQTDVIAAWGLWRLGIARWNAYHRFRHWTDVIADRPSPLKRTETHLPRNV
jgi:hypothetical protein